MSLRRLKKMGQTDHCTTAAIEKNGPDRPLHGIRLRRQAQLTLLNELAAYYPDLPFYSQPEGTGRYYYDQDWLGHADAIVLFCLIQKYRFKKIIEVGSGFSSAAILDATSGIWEQ